MNFQEEDHWFLHCHVTYHVPHTIAKVSWNDKRESSIVLVVPLVW